MGLGEVTGAAAGFGEVATAAAAGFGEVAAAAAAGLAGDCEVAAAAAGDAVLALSFVGEEGLGGEPVPLLQQTKEVMESGLVQVQEARV